MAVQRIRRVSDLPRWFDLKKYDGLEMFDLEDWAAALRIRTYLEHKRGSDLKDFPGRLRLLEALQHDPLFRGVDTRPKLEENPQTLVFRTVRLLNVCDAYGICDLWKVLPKKFQQAINGIGVEQQRLLSQPFELSLPHDAYDVTDSNGGTPHLVIDLAAPDEILVKDFQRTLDAVRAAYQWPEPTHFALTEATRSWIEFRVLPYFDLNLWSLEMGVKIPQQVYGEALFPNEPGVGLGDRVRRTVRLKAREVVSGQMVESLRLQAAAT